MEDFSYTGLTTGVALLAYYFTLIKSGAARGKFGVQAPSHDGPNEYLRYVRAHQNTLEHIVIFLPALWLFSYAVDPFWGSDNRFTVAGRKNALRAWLLSKALKKG